MRSALIRLAVSLLVASSVGQASALAPQASQAVNAEQLIRLLESTSGAWNRGDLDAFVAPYAEDATYMTAAGPILKDAMRTRYAAKYFTGGHPDQQVRFDECRVRPLGEDYALMTGRFTLSGGKTPERSGWFSLVWMRTPGGWRISLPIWRTSPNG